MEKVKEGTAKVGGKKYTYYRFSTKSFASLNHLFSS